MANYSDARIGPQHQRYAKSRSQSKENVAKTQQQKKIEVFRKNIHRSNATYRHVVSNRGQNFYFKNPPPGEEKLDVKSTKRVETKKDESLSKSPPHSPKSPTKKSETLSDTKSKCSPNTKSETKSKLKTHSTTKMSRKTTKPIRSPTHDNESELEKEGVQIINIRSAGESTFNLKSLHTKSSKHHAEMAT